MKRLYLVAGTVGALLVASLFVTSSSSHASKPFFSFCLKIHQTAKDNAPANFVLPNGNSTCPSGFSLNYEINPAALIVDLNTISKAMFNQGWALGNYQTSVQDQSQPCIPGQPGCGH